MQIGETTGLESAGERGNARLLCVMTGELI